MSARSRAMADRVTAVKTVIVVVAVALLALVAWRALQPSATGYRAEFTHASGIRTGDEVRVAGIGSGSVTGIELDGGNAVVEFDLQDDVRLHTNSEARVKLASMLGTTYLEITAGSGTELESGGTLTTANTAPSYTLSDAFTDGNDVLQGLDLDAIDRAISTLSTELDQDPELVDTVLDEAAGLARMIGEKDAQIDRLLTYTRDVTGIVRDQQDELERLLVNAETVTSLVQRRRDTIASLVQNAKGALTTLDTMADRNDKTMRTLLAQFDETLAILTKHTDELGETLRRAAPFSRYFANATGNGPWLEVGAPYFLFPDAIACPLVQPPGGCS